MPCRARALTARRYSPRCGSALQEEWQALVARRMQYLGHVQSDYIVSAAEAEAAHWGEVREGAGWRGSVAVPVRQGRRRAQACMQAVALLLSACGSQPPPCFAAGRPAGLAVGPLRQPAWQRAVRRRATAHLHAAGRSG